MKIRYIRDMGGAEQMFQDGYCWADSVLWAIDHPDGQIMTIEDVGGYKKCGYCGRCMTLKEREDYQSSKERTIDERA